MMPDELLLGHRIVPTVDQIKEVQAYFLLAADEMKKDRPKDAKDPREHEGGFFGQ